MRMYLVCTSTSYLTLCTAVPQTPTNDLFMRRAADGIRTHDLLHGKQTL